MKIQLYLIISLLCFSSTNYAQTFSGAGLPIAQGGWNNSQFVNIVVSGLSNPLTAGSLELIQVNIEIESTGSISSRVGYDVISPDGTTIILKQGGGQHGNTFGCAPGASTIKHYDVKYRDPCSGGGCNNLQKLCDAGSFVKPFNGGYYGPDVSCTFQNTIGENPNGTWQVHFYENSISTTPQILKVELIFGVLDNVNITSSTTNDVCYAPQPFCDSKPVCYENTNHTGDVSSDPFTTATNPCAWNSAINNTGWFSWIASSTSSTVTISGLSSSQQVIAFGDNVGNCDPNDYFVLAGGCPTDAVNSVNNYTNGSFDNIVLNISGLSIGNTYYLAIDGNSGDVSHAYLSVEGAILCNSILPIDLINFSVKNGQNENLVSWSTQSEINSDFFVLEKSVDTKNWETLNKIQAAGNSSQIIDYYFRDEQNSVNLIYYRIKQVDFDGRYSYSKIISSNSNPSAEVSIFPNPFNDNFTIELPNSNEITKIEVLDNSGRIIYSKNIDHQSILVVNLDPIYTEGLYYVRIFSKKDVLTKKVIKISYQ